MKAIDADPVGIMKWEERERKADHLGKREDRAMIHALCSKKSWVWSNKSTGHKVSLGDGRGEVVAVNGVRNHEAEENEKEEARNEWAKEHEKVLRSFFLCDYWGGGEGTSRGDWWSSIFHKLITFLMVLPIYLDRSSREDEGEGSEGDLRKRKEPWTELTLIIFPPLFCPEQEVNSWQKFEWKQIQSGRTGLVFGAQGRHYHMASSSSPSHDESILQEQRIPLNPGW